MKRQIKNLFRVFAVLLIISLVLNNFKGGISVMAAGIEDGSYLLSNVTIKNSDTSEVIGTGDKITADDKLLVEYYLKDLLPVGSNKNVEQGTTYTFVVPDELKVLSQGSWILRAANNTLGQCSYDSATNTIQVTFDDGIFDPNGFAADGVTGTYIGFTACLNSDELGDKDNQSLKFQIANGEYAFSFVYGEDAKMSKTGSYDKDSERITWTITVDEGNKSYNKLLFQDTFSANQQYIEGSLKEKLGDGAFAVCNNVTASGNTISYEYVPGASTRTFTYQTKFTDAALNPDNATNNKVELTATNNANIVNPNDNNKEIANTGEVTVKATVTVESQYPSTVILDKVGKWHVREDNGLLWHITVNEAKQNFGNDVYLIETIGGGQAEAGDIKQKLGDNPIRNVKVNNKEATAEQLSKITVSPAGAGFTSNEYKIAFGDLLDGNTVEFDFFTLMSEEEIEFYQGNNHSEELARNARNTVTMYQTYTQLKYVDAIVRAYPKVLDKSFENYDYSTRELEWKIDVNYDFMKLDDVVLEDTISAGSFADKVIVKTYENGDSTYVADTTQLSETPNQKGMYYKYNEQKKLLTIYIGDIPRNTKYDVMVYTVLEPEDEINDNGTVKKLSDYNGAIEVGNKVTMKKEGSSPVTVEATGTIDNKILEKSGKVTGAGVASYEIKLNQAQMKWPQQSEVVDIMSPGMTLDVASIQLYEASVAEDGTMTAAKLVDKDSYERNHLILEEGNKDGELAGSTKLTVVLPDNAGEKAYILKYDTILQEDTTYDNFTNKVKIQGVTSKETNTDTLISAKDLRGYGGATIITYSKVKLIKQNEEKATLEGAEFTLFLDGEEIDKKTTDKNGEIIFSYLTPGATYTIKETKAPEGYELDKTAAGTWEFVAKDKGDKYYLENPHVFINKPKTTEEPTTEEPTTSEPTTSEPTTSEPTTSEPTTSEPTTSEPTTSEPTTEEPTTSEPTTSEPTTSEPTTSEPTTSEPTTSEPTTSEPTTEEPTTSEPTTSEPTTSEPTTSEPTTTDDSDREEESKTEEGLNNNQQSNGDKGPQTGDRNGNIFIIMLIGFVDLMCLVGMHLVRKKN